MNLVFQAPYKATPALPQSWSDAVGNLFECLERGASRDEMRAAIKWVESEMADLPQVEQPVKHHFVNRMYWREVFNPKGSFIVTKIHREPNISVITKGRLGCITEDGMKVLEAPAIFETNPDTKRILFAQEDTVFHTVHPNPTDTRDLDELERRIIAPDFQTLECEEAL